MMVGADWAGKDGASEDEIRKLQSRMPIELPASFYNFLRVNNGGEGFASSSPFYFVLFSTEELVSFIDEIEEIRECFPDFIFFGTSGGSDWIAFDTRTGPPFKIISTEVVGWPEYAIECAADFEAFLQSIGRRRDVHDEAGFGGIE